MGCLMCGTISHKPTFIELGYRLGLNCRQDREAKPNKLAKYVNPRTTKLFTVTN